MTTEVAIGVASAALSALALGHQVVIAPSLRRRETSRQERRDAARRVLGFLPEMQRRITAARWGEATLGEVADACERLSEELRVDLSPDLNGRLEEVPPLLRQIERLDLAGDTKMTHVEVFLRWELEEAAKAEVLGRRPSSRTIPSLAEAQDLLAKGQQLMTGLEPYIDACWEIERGSRRGRVLLRTYFQGVTLGAVFGASVAYLLTQWL